MHGGMGAMGGAQQRNKEIFCLPSFCHALSQHCISSSVCFPPMQGCKSDFRSTEPRCLLAMFVFFLPGWVSLFLPGDAPPEPRAARGAVLIPATEPHGSTPAPTLQNQPCPWGWGEQTLPPSLLTDRALFPTTQPGTLHGRGRRSTAGAAPHRCVCCAFRLLSVCFLPCCLFHALWMIVVLGLISRYAKENKGF